MWRDADGRTLQDYPHPLVAVDVVLLTVVQNDPHPTLAVLLHRPQAGFAKGQWCLPGTFVHPDELLAGAALRALREKVGVAGERPSQLTVFDALDRDVRDRVLSVAHVDLVPAGRLTGLRPDCTLAPVVGERVELPGDQPALPYDHEAIVAEAVGWARAAHVRGPDPCRLLGPEFPLSVLQRLHEAVAGTRLVKDTFRRGVLDALEPSGRERTGTVGRPAALYRHASAERAIPGPAAGAMPRVRTKGSRT